MRFTVLWTATAERNLTSIWLSAEDYLQSCRYGNVQADGCKAQTRTTIPRFLVFLSAS